VLPAAVGARRAARERALGLLYEAETKALAPSQVIAELPVPPDRFANDLVVGVEAREAEIDGLIATYAIGWTVERMPVVDRALLRLATYELLGRPDVPTGVVLSEAVELATQYSTEESGRFVNGVLSAIAAQVRGQDPDPLRAGSDQGDPTGSEQRDGTPPAVETGSVVHDPNSRVSGEPTSAASSDPPARNTP
jgi:N utilization substance protein B